MQGNLNKTMTKKKKEKRRQNNMVHAITLNWTSCAVNKILKTRQNTTTTNQTMIKSTDEHCCQYWVVAYMCAAYSSGIRISSLKALFDTFDWAVFLVHRVLLFYCSQQTVDILANFLALLSSHILSRPLESQGSVYKPFARKKKRIQDCFLQTCCSINMIQIRGVSVSCTASTRQACCFLAFVQYNT